MTLFWKEMLLTVNKNKIEELQRKRYLHQFLSATMTKKINSFSLDFKAMLTPACFNWNFPLKWSAIASWIEEKTTSKSQ